MSEDASVPRRQSEVRGGAWILGWALERRVLGGRVTVTVSGASIEKEGKCGMVMCSVASSARSSCASESPRCTTLVKPDGSACACGRREA
jgi:hypothetical protein